MGRNGWKHKKNYSKILPSSQTISTTVHYVQSPSMVTSCTFISGTFAYLCNLSLHIKRKIQNRIYNTCTRCNSSILDTTVLTQIHRSCLQWGPYSKENWQQLNLQINDLVPVYGIAWDMESLSIDSKDISWCHTNVDPICQRWSTNCSDPTVEERSTQGQSHIRPLPLRATSPEAWCNIS